METGKIWQRETQTGKKEVRAGREEECFLITSGGRILDALLPGEERTLRIPEGSCLITVRRDAVLSGVLGCGGLHFPDGSRFGAWFRFTCRLLSPRRFARACSGEAGGDGLPEEMRRRMQKEMQRIPAETAETSFPEHFFAKYMENVRTHFEKEAERAGLEVLSFVPGRMTGEEAEI